MAKINISFNNKNYNISDEALSASLAELRQHLSTNMSGTGATITLGGTAYNIDSAKLTTATTDFVTHLGKISGSGYKVKVNGVEYSVGSDKVTGSVSTLETVLGGLNSGSDMTTLAAGLYQSGAIALYEAGDVAGASAMLKTSWEDLVADGVIAVSEGAELPEGAELNEYGFYYGVEYSITMEGMTVGFTFNNDGSVIFNQAGEIIDVPAGVIVYSDHLIDMSAMDMPILEVSADGMSITGDGIILSLGDGTPSRGTVYISPVDGEIPVFAGDLVLPNDGSATAIQVNTFANQNSLTGIFIPDSVTTICESAFHQCNNLTSVVIEDGVTSIGSGAFYYCSSLTSVVIPDSVTSIGDTVFSNCDSLTSVVIPNSVTSIGENVFENCDNLTSVVIPDSVTSIGYQAFYKCSSITSIAIPDSVTFIDGWAFAYCSLTDINYAGTVEQWRAITRGSSWNYNVPATYVQCSDGQVAL